MKRTRHVHPKASQPLLLFTLFLMIFSLILILKFKDPMAKGAAWLLVPQPQVEKIQKIPQRKKTCSKAEMWLLITHLRLFWYQCSRTCLSVLHSLPLFSEFDHERDRSTLD